MCMHDRYSANLLARNIVADNLTKFSLFSSPLLSLFALLSPLGRTKNFGLKLLDEKEMPRGLIWRERRLGL